MSSGRAGIESACEEDEGASSVNALHELVQPVVMNTYWVKQALELYDGISMHAEELNAKHSHFFGLAQKFSIDSAVLGICKMFDTSNRRHKKHTVRELLRFLSKNMTSEYARRLTTRHLILLSIPEAEANKVVEALHRENNFEAARSGMLAVIEDMIPTIERDTSLNRLFLARNKMIAHQEQLDKFLKEELRLLPPLEEIERLADWVWNFCKLLYCVLTPDSVPVETVVSGKIAALNVAAKVLGKDFDDPSKSPLENFQERNAFYGR